MCSTRRPPRGRRPARTTSMSPRRRRPSSTGATRCRPPHPTDAAIQPDESFYAAAADGTNARARDLPDDRRHRTRSTRTAPASPSTPGSPRAGQPYRFAGFYPVVGDGGYGQVQLVVGTSDSTCASPPVTVGTFDSQHRRLAAELLARRVARRLLRRRDEHRDDRVRRDRQAPGDLVPRLRAGRLDARSTTWARTGGPAAPPRVQWTPSGQLAWARSTSSGWQIVTAPDRDRGAGDRLHGLPRGDAAPNRDALGRHRDRRLPAGRARRRGEPRTSSSSTPRTTARWCTSTRRSPSPTGGSPGMRPTSPSRRTRSRSPSRRSTPPRTAWTPGREARIRAATSTLHPWTAASPPAPSRAIRRSTGRGGSRGAAPIAYTRIDTNPYQTSRQLVNLIRPHRPSAEHQRARAGHRRGRVADHRSRRWYDGGRGDRRQRGLLLRWAGAPRRGSPASSRSWVSRRSRAAGVVVRRLERQRECGLKPGQPRSPPSRPPVMPMLYDDSPRTS